MKKAKEIHADVKAVLQETVGKSSKVQIRIVHWIADGVDTGPKLEKRSFFKKKDGTFSDRGSCKGFGKADLEFIVGDWSEIQLFFQ